MRVQETELAGVKLIAPDVHGDARGFFFEAWNQKALLTAGIDQSFVQLNFSRSARGIIRGLHYQHPKPQAKLIMVLQGSVFDVAVDLRAGSPSFGQWWGGELSESNRRQLYIPEGFAHGFCALTPEVTFGYLVSEYYFPEHDRAIAWNDPDIGIDWPLKPSGMSQRDAAAPLLKSIGPADLPRR